jgi:2-(1,2-epoxy-1,2-dihydrophenyl)acetyl-CoA isomerase
MSNVLTTEDRGHVRTITLNRPERKNALSNDLAWGILGAIEDASKDDNDWVNVVTGSGDAY